MLPAWLPQGNWRYWLYWTLFYTRRHAGEYRICVANFYLCKPVCISLANFCLCCHVVFVWPTCVSVINLYLCWLVVFVWRDIQDDFWMDFQTNFKAVVLTDLQTDYQKYFWRNKNQGKKILKKKKKSFETIFEEQTNKMVPLWAEEARKKSDVGQEFFNFMKAKKNWI